MNEGFALHEIIRDTDGRPCDYRFLEVNPAFERLTGLRAPEVVGRTLTEVLPDSEGAWIRHFDRAATEGTAIRFEREMSTRGRWFHISAYSPAADRVAMVFTDVTDIRTARESLEAEVAVRQQAEAELREVNAELERRVRRRTAQLQQRANQLARLASELTLAEQRERNRLAEVLHDDLQQILVAARFHLDLAGSRARSGCEIDDMLVQIDTLLGQAIAKSRSLSRELGPPTFSKKRFVAALEWLTEQMQDKHGMTVDIHCEGDIEPDAEAVRVFLYKALQEMLLNIIKHAGVREALVRLRRCGGQIELTVSDRGKGFDAPAATSAEEVDGFGLFSIRERLGLLGGRMETHSKPDEGATIILTVPAKAVQAQRGATPRLQQ